ncbi:MAG: DNA (cytosine-5-)-methyltransferase [Firmicutes bacterium]|nr:DNA (cytosine-5-)-methyltransferase [Candidatus Colivicinus equi]
MKKIRLATVFSGIGAIEFALKRMHVDHELVFACDNGDREISYDIEKERQKVFAMSSLLEKKKYVDELYAKSTSAKNYVQQSYLANYDLNEDKFYQDIILLDGRDYRGKVDLFVGGSPCQSFSSVGAQGGLDDARGTLFYEYARLVSEIQPKVFIYENVRNLINHDGGKTWTLIKRIFDSLGYDYRFEVLNAADYGIPQTRRRLIVVGFKKSCKNFVMPPETVKLKYKMKDFSINNCDEGYFTCDENGDINIQKKKGKPDDKYTLSPKLYAYVMKGGTKTFYQKPKINLDIARTVLQTMGNRHRAGVDNYMSFDGTENLGSVRMLTEREAHRLMGFTDDYKIVVSRAQAYKQAGNSIVVDVLIAVLNSIFDTKIFDN